MTMLDIFFFFIFNLTEECAESFISKLIDIKKADNNSEVGVKKVFSKKFYRSILLKILYLSAIIQSVVFFFKRKRNIMAYNKFDNMDFLMPIPHFYFNLYEEAYIIKGTSYVLFLNKSSKGDSLKFLRYSLDSSEDFINTASIDEVVDNVSGDVRMSIIFNLDALRSISDGRV